MSLSTVENEEMISAGQKIGAALSELDDPRADMAAEAVESVTQQLIESVGDAASTQASARVQSPTAGAAARQRPLILDRSWDASHRATWLRYESERYLAIAQGDLTRAAILERAQHALYPDRLAPLRGTFEAELGFQATWDHQRQTPEVTAVADAVDLDRFVPVIAATTQALRDYVDASREPEAAAQAVSQKVASRAWFASVEAVEVLLRHTLDAATHARVFTPLERLRQLHRDRLDAARAQSASKDTRPDNAVPLVTEE